jgi:hypothetical protein
MRTILRAGCVSLVIFGVFCGVARASTHSGNQDPDLVVTASIGPNHLDVGQRSYWSASVTNTTSHSVRIRILIEVTTPFSGSDEFIGGTLGPGQSINEQRSFTAREGGEYTVRVKARDANGTSHTHASAVA